MRLWYLTKATDIGLLCQQVPLESEPSVHNRQQGFLLPALFCKAGGKWQKLLLLMIMWQQLNDTSLYQPNSSSTASFKPFIVELLAPRAHSSRALERGARAVRHPGAFHTLSFSLPSSNNNSSISFGGSCLSFSFMISVGVISLSDPLGVHMTQDEPINTLLRLMVEMEVGRAGDSVFRFLSEELGKKAPLRTKDYSGWSLSLHMVSWHPPACSLRTARCAPSPTKKGT